MPLQIIVPSTKCLHSTLGALGCPPLLGVGPAPGTGFALTSFSSQNLPKMVSLRGAAMVLVLRAPPGAVAGEGGCL